MIAQTTVHSFKLGLKSGLLSCLELEESEVVRAFLTNKREWSFFSFSTVLWFFIRPDPAWFRLGRFCTK